MTSVDNNGPERGGDDIVAAEYVLGVLPAAERTAAARRIDLEAAFARLVEQWEGYFAPLARGLPGGRAAGLGQAGARPPAVRDRRRRAEHAAAAEPVVEPRAVARRWPRPRSPPSRSMSPCPTSTRRSQSRKPGSSPRSRADGSDVRYLAVYDAATGEVALSRVSGERGAGQDFELWMVEGQNAPVSMGVDPCRRYGAARGQAGDAGQARQGRRAGHQPRAGGRFADRPAHRPVVAAGGLQEHLTK